MNQMEADRWRLDHMLQAATQIEECVVRRHEGKLVEIALQKLVQNIGEMARGISPAMKAAYADIPWNNIIGMRNILVHEYYKLDKETLWDVAEHKIPALKDWIKGIMEAGKE